MPALIIASPRRLASVAFITLVLACTAEAPSPPGSPGGSTQGGTGATAGEATTAGSPGTAGSPSGAGGGGGGAGAPIGGGGSSPSGGTDGTVNTAGSGGAAGSNTAGGGSTTSDYCGARSGLTFCDTFEAHVVGAAQAKAPWAPAINGDGEVTIDGSVSHSGSHSLKVRGSGFSTFFVLSGAPLPSSTGRLHVRMFLRLAEAMTKGHNTFLVADTQAAPGTGNAFRLGEMHEMLMYTVSGDTHGALANENYYNDQLLGAALTAGNWGCVEVALDHEKPELQVWLDGKEVADLHHTDWPVDAYDALRFGFEKYAGPVSDVWYDDIAIGTGPIGCN